MRLLAAICSLVFLPAPAAKRAPEWRHYGGDAGGMKYSPLDQINRTNVAGLRPAWIFDSADFSDGRQYPTRSAFETTPLLVNGVLYVSTSFHRLFALDAETGAILWEFDPKFDRYTRTTLLQSRGVAYWEKGAVKRVLLGDQQARLFSIDARTGKPDPAFGDNGMVDLKRGITENFPNAMYGPTSPPAVCGDTIVTGAASSDGEPARSQRRRPRMGRTHGKAVVALSHRASSRRVRQRHLGRRFVERPRRRQRVVHHERR